MFSIGDFAKLGQVSVRMLRHYDAIGLLIPVAVDPASGYRYYQADQLRRLNRVIALKDLGFTLQQVREILDDRVNGDELRGMLRLRRAQLEAQVTADAARLAGVEARLRMIEREGCMKTEDVVVKAVAPIRVAELTGAANYRAEEITPMLQSLYPQLLHRLDAAGIRRTGPTIAYYEPAPGESGESGESGEAVMVHAAVTVGADRRPAHDFAVVDLPAVRSAATIIHHGALADVGQSIDVLAQWIEGNGYRMDGYPRHVYLEHHRDDPDKNVTELQVSVVKNTVDVV